jgi:hypothetical protein
MRYNTKSESSSGLGLILVLLLLCMGGTVAAIQSQTPHPTSRVYVSENTEPVLAPVAVTRRAYLSAGMDQASR